MPDNSVFTPETPSPNADDQPPPTITPKTPWWQMMLLYPTVALALITAFGGGHNGCNWLNSRA